MLTELAPAKINLTLEVLGKRPDGYHEVRTILQTVSLCDSFHFESGQRLGFNSSLPEWKAEESLVAKSARLLRETAGCRRGATITVDKRIPLTSGLGGDSSDAAATLRGLNRLWKLDLPPEALLKLAAQLGSDVPFLIHGGTALAAGRGDKLTQLPSLPHMWVVLVVPKVPRLPDKTKQMYASLKPNHYTDGQITQRLVAVLKGGGEFTSSLLFNTFENVAFTRNSELAKYRSHLMKMGADNVHLAGSGPAVFSLVKDKAQAEDLFTRCKNQGMETYLVETTGSN